MDHMAPILAVSCVVVGVRGVLLVQRGEPPFAGLWSLPGGRVLPGEDARAAVARETFEETSITVAAGEELGKTNVAAYAITTFLARPIDPAAVAQAGTDAVAARWVAWSELAQYPLTPGLAELLAHVSR
jgi:ADP-ribose pyrophosphatase YjhB (NUDIX family)